MNRPTWPFKGSSLITPYMLSISYHAVSILWVLMRIAVMTCGRDMRSWCVLSDHKKDNTNKHARNRKLCVYVSNYLQKYTEKCQPKIHTCTNKNIYNLFTRKECKQVKESCWRGRYIQYVSRDTKKGLEISCQSFQMRWISTFLHDVMCNPVTVLGMIKPHVLCMWKK